MSSSYSSPQVPSDRSPSSLPSQSGALSSLILQSSPLCLCLCPLTISIISTALFHAPTFSFLLVFFFLTEHFITYHVFTHSFRIQSPWGQRILFFFFNFIFTLFYFTVLYWFCHTLIDMKPPQVYTSSQS